MNETKYAEVSRIIKGVSPFLGGFFVELSDKFSSGEISREQVIVEMRRAQRKVDESITELSAIRFPGIKQRTELAKFIAGIRQFRKSTEIMIDGMERCDPTGFTKANELQTQAAKAAGKYADFIYKDRLRAAR